MVEVGWLQPMRWRVGSRRPLSAAWLPMPVPLLPTNALQLWHCILARQVPRVAAEDPAVLRGLEVKRGGGGEESAPAHLARQRGQRLACSCLITRARYCTL